MLIHVEMKRSLKRTKMLVLILDKKINKVERPISMQCLPLEL